MLSWTMTVINGSSEGLDQIGATGHA